MCITVILLYCTDWHNIVHKSAILHLKNGGDIILRIGYKRNGRRSKGEGAITQNPRTTCSQLCCWSSLTAGQKPVHLPGFLSEWSESATVKGGWPCKFTPVIQGESARISVGLTHSPTHVLSTSKLSSTGGVYLIHVWRYT